MQLEIEELRRKETVRIVVYGDSDSRINCGRGEAYYLMSDTEESRNRR